MTFAIPNLARLDFKFTKRKFNTVIFPYIVIYLAPFIDMFNGFIQNTLMLPSPVGLLFRGLIIIYTLQYVLNYRNSFFSVLSLISLILFCIALPIWMLVEPGFSISIDLTYFMRLLYYMCIVSYFWKFKGYFDLKYLATLMNNAAVISALSMLFCAITGLGTHTYEVMGVKLGTRGFFTAGNDVGLFMNICLIATIVNLNYYHTFRQILIIFITYCSNLVIATRVGIVGSSLIMSFFVGGLLLNKLPNLRIKKGVLLGTKVLLVGSLVCVIFALVSFIQSSQYLLDRFTASDSANTRSLLISAANESILNLSDQEIVIGRGYSGSMRSIALIIGKGINEDDYKATEAEFHDTISSYGYLLGGIILILYIIPVIYGIKLYFKKRNYITFWNATSLVLFIGVAYVAGHAFTNAMVFPPMCVIFIMAYYSPKFSLNNAK